MPANRDLEAKNPAALLKRIKYEFPKISWNNYEFLNHGWDHEVIILDNKLVFRFPNSSKYLSAFKDEVNLLNYLVTKTKTKIPNYKYVVSDYSFAGYEIIPGTELSEELFQLLTIEEKQKIAEQLAEFLTAIHTVNVNELSRFNIATADMVSEAKKLRKQVNKFLQGVLTKDEYAQVLQILEEVDVIVNKPLPVALIHNDISSSHIIWDSVSKTVGIIDFSDRCLSDPAYDFMELFLYGKVFAEQVFGMYEGLKDEEFLHRAWVYLKRLGVYILVDSFINDKITYKKAKTLFDKVISS